FSRNFSSSWRGSSRAIDVLGAAGQERKTWMPAQTNLRSLRKLDRERGHVADQMAALQAIAEGLHRHHASMQDARPHGEPDQAEVARRLTRRNQQEDAEHRPALATGSQFNFPGFIGRPSPN